MKIKSIQFSGFSDVYNMHVEETHSFAVEGGIIVHNCYDETRYACMSQPIAPKPKKEEESRIEQHKKKVAKGTVYKFKRIV